MVDPPETSPAAATRRLEHSTRFPSGGRSILLVQPRQCRRRPPPRNHGRRGWLRRPPDHLPGTRPQHRSMRQWIIHIGALVWPPSRLTPPRDGAAVARRRAHQGRRPATLGIWADHEAMSPKPWRGRPVGRPGNARVVSLRIPETGVQTRLTGAIGGDVRSSGLRRARLRRPETLGFAQVRDPFSSAAAGRARAGSPKELRRRSAVGFTWNDTGQRVGLFGFEHHIGR